MTLSEISAQTSLANNTVSVVVDGMVRKGMIQRKTDPENRRQTIISLTDSAKSMKKTYQKVSQRMNKLFYRNFSVMEKNIFEGYLERILETLKLEVHT